MLPCLFICPLYIHVLGSFLCISCSSKYYENVRVIWLKGHSFFKLVIRILLLTLKGSPIFSFIILLSSQKLRQSLFTYTCPIQVYLYWHFHIVKLLDIPILLALIVYAHIEHCRWMKIWLKDGWCLCWIYRGLITFPDLLHCDRFTSTFWVKNP